MLQFIAGALFGVTLSATVAAVLLSIPGDSAQDVAGVDKKGSRRKSEPSQKREKAMSPEDLQILEKAILELKGKQSQSAATSFTTEPISPRRQTATAEEVTEQFNQTLREVRARVKDMKNFHAFFSDLGKLYAYSHKELGRAAERALKHTDLQEEAKELGLEETNQTLPSARWLSIGKYVSTLSQDHESLAILINSNIVTSASKHHEEMNMLEKRLAAEGQALVTKKKELAGLFEARLKARDRHASELAEEALREANARLGEAEKELLTLLPRVTHDLNVIICLKSSEDLRLMLLQFGRKMEGASLQATRNVTRFLTLFSAMHTSREYEEDLLTHLVYMRNSAEADSITIDMKLDSTASLAAGAPCQLPRMPSFFASSIESETCIWFNAFIGRMWRDIARSAYFHEWVTSRVSLAINNNKPEFLDNLSVTSVEFGAIPPLFSNVRWIPTSSATDQGEPDPDADFNVSCACDITFRSGIKFIVEARVWLNKTMAVSINIKLELELLELHGSMIFGCQREACYITFLENPYTSLTVNSEIGSKYKLTDLPLLSEYIVKRVRTSIRNNLVNPSKHRFRLIWPRTWWPTGTEHLFPPLLDLNARAPGTTSHAEGANAADIHQEKDSLSQNMSPSAGTQRITRLKQWMKGGGVRTPLTSGESEGQPEVRKVASTTVVSVAAMKHWIGEKTSKYSFGQFRLRRTRDGSGKAVEGEGEEDGEEGEDEDESEGVVFSEEGGAHLREDKAAKE